MNTFQSDEQFLSHYQFDHDPFAARVPNFKFFSAQRKTILGQMHHLARHSQLMLIITGPKDSGKTLLRQALIASLNKEAVRIVNISAKECSKPSQVIAVLSDSLNFANATPEMIIDGLTELAEKGTSLYLMVDDAEDLPDDTLQLLLNFTSEQLKSFHIFLFARPALLEKLEESSLGKEVTFNLPLTPYTLDETKEYLTLRLEGVGQSSKLFTDGQLLDIYTRSGGWPGVINQVAKELLLVDMENQPQEMPVSQKSEQKPEPTMSFNDNKQDPEPRIDSLFTEQEEKATSFFAVDDDKVKGKAKSSGFIPKKHLAIAGVVAIVLLGVIFFSRSSNTPATNDTDNNIVADHYATLSDTDTQTTTLPLTTGAEVSQSIPLNNGEPNNLPPVNGNDTMPTTDIPVVTNTPPVVSTLPVTSQDNTMATANVTEPSTPATTTQTAEIKPQTTSTTKPAAEPTRTQPAAKNTASGNAWYRDQASSYYTIQVSVASSVKSAQDFIKKHAGDYRYYKRSRSGKVDYVITYGRFSGRTLAQNEIKKLPKEIQSSKPWVRTFASIKPELAK